MIRTAYRGLSRAINPELVGVILIKIPDIRQTVTPNLLNKRNRNW